MEKKSNSKIVLKNVSTNLILQFVAIISGFIIPKLLIGTYGSSTYGLVASITQFLALIVLLEAGIGPVIKAKLYKYIAKNDKNKILLILKDGAKFFKTIGIIFIIYAIALCFIYPFFNKEFDTYLTVALIIIITLGTLFEYFFGLIYNIYLQADKKYYVASAAQIFCYILNIILVIVLIKCGASIIIVKIANLIAFGIKPFFQAYYVRKKLNIKIEEAKGEYKIDNKFDGLSQHIAFVINNSTDIAILTIFSNLANVAVYTVYNLINTAIKNIVSAFINGMDAIFGDLMAKGEKTKLRNSFEMYEFIYYTVSVTIFSCAIILTVPFIGVYMKGITDANYYQPLFAVILILSGFFISARSIYSSLIYSIGHFKQTNLVVWIEAITNIVLSIILVPKLGLVGVVIGTLVASLIRLLYFIYYATTKILERNILTDIKWIITLIIEYGIIYLLFNLELFKYEPSNYITWTIYALIVLIITLIIITIINILLNKQTFKKIYNYLKIKIQKNKK